MYGNTIIGVVGPPYPYCSLVAFLLLLGCVFVLLVLFVLFCAFLCFFVLFLCFFVLLMLLVCAKSFRKRKNEEFKTALITSFTLLVLNIRMLSSRKFYLVYILLIIWS